MKKDQSQEVAGCIAPRLGNLFLLYLNGNVSSDIRKHNRPAGLRANGLPSRVRLGRRDGVFHGQWRLRL